MSSAPASRWPTPSWRRSAASAASAASATPTLLIFANDQCLRLGLDVVATCAALGFMMECQQEGLNRSGTLPWGDDDAVLAAIARLGQKQEKRDVLSLGVGEMKEIFWGSEAFAPQIKGMAMPGIDPRAMHRDRAGAGHGTDRRRLSLCDGL